MSQGQVNIRWFGHSMFMIWDDKVKMVIDPFDDSVGYEVPDVTADFVLVSHRHFDHDNVSAVKGKPEVIEGQGERSSKEVKFTGIDSVHDEKDGTLRGKNTLFVWELGGIRFVHLGDQGVMLNDEQMKKMGNVDVLFVPVGGYFTIDAGVASQIVTALNPRVVIPMHYKTEVMGENFPISGVDDFLKGKKRVEKAGKNTLTFTRESLPSETTIYVLNYK
jgi:L-ascorbate metabolism protein UlaG (beta-lactamase superfamily)